METATKVYFTIESKKQIDILHTRLFKALTRGRETTG